jgi:hypothetical protein
LLVLAVAVLLATSSAGATPSTGTTAAAEAGDTGDEGAEANGPGGDAGEGSSDSSSEDDGSAGFRTPGGDNSVQNFGEEAEATEREAAEAALAGYLEARAEGDWAGQCDYLAKVTLKPIEQLAARSPEVKGKGCAALLEALSAGLPASARADTMTDGIGSLRVEGERGFVLYHGAEGVDYFVPMLDEDGEWKVAALAPTESP